ncbi:DUF3224 domain-containing protein [Nocardioides panzhihuensis]|uniref:DUF3224 domain-containing protein n=1 Tax=Nocardioides panzhihuensis TaxID=860243 RepID=A0A7Z0DT08_9ACTN|nr:DUF3224 domain-containing protein [Nocardioides panzhihuensis]NYI81113.1 hypothetical protein [Nocardioides panzhihuensis]
MTEHSRDTTYSNKASTTMTVARWQEAAYVDIDGEGTTMGNDIYIPHRGLTTSETDYTYTGEIEGKGVARMIGAYGNPAGGAVFEAYEQFTGSIAGQEGSCVWRISGTYADKTVRSHLTVIPGLGTGGLEGLVGEADMVLAEEGGGETYGFVLSYDWS